MLSSGTLFFSAKHHFKGNKDSAEPGSSKTRNKVSKGASASDKDSVKQRKPRAFTEFNDTAEIVQYFNHSAHLEEKLAFKGLFDLYIQYIDNAESVPEPSYWRSYLRLGNIEFKREYSMKEFWLQWLNSICKKVNSVTPIAVESLEVALKLMPREIFSGNMQPLTHISHKLFRILAPDREALVKENVSCLRPTLMALHQIFAIMQEIMRSGLLNKEQLIFFSMKDKLKAIKKDQSYFPMYYLTCQVEQTFLCTEDCSAMAKISGYFWRFLPIVKSQLRMWDVAQELANLELTLESLQNQIAEMRGLSKEDRTWTKKWYNKVMYFNFLALCACFDEGHFNDYIRKATVFWDDSPSGVVEIDEPKMVQYATILQFCFLVSQSENKIVRKRALDCFLTFTERYKLRTFDCDRDIVEALLNTLGEIYVLVSDAEKDQVQTAIEVMTFTDVDSISCVYSEWLCGVKLERKLFTFYDHGKSSNKDVFLEDIKKQLNILTCEEIEELRAELKDKYSSRQFAKIPLSIDKNNQNHLGNLEFSFRRIDKQDEDKTLEISEKTTASKSMDITDFFARKTSEGDTNSTLLYGMPGIGKTSAIKKLAYLWSIGEWGSDFDYVFLLHVDDLKPEDFDGYEVKKNPSLATAVAKLCFNHREKEAFIAMRKYVKDKLEEKTTLLIIDGLEKSRSACTTILEEAKSSSCRLLFTCRTFNIKDEREMVDDEVELVGFNEDQLIRFISRELKNLKPLEFISTLKESANMWKMMLVPLMANLMCVVWKNAKEAMNKHRTFRSINLVYKQLMRYMWTQFSASLELRHNEITAFKGLGKVATESLHGSDPSIHVINLDTHVSYSLQRDLIETGVLYKSGYHQFYFTQYLCQEYFVGQELARCVSKGEGREKQRAQKFLRENKYSSSHRIMMRFLVEEVSDKGDTTFDELISLVDEDPRNVLEWNHLLSNVWILDGWLIGSPCMTIEEMQQRSERANEIIEQLKDVVRRTSNDVFMLGIIYEKLELSSEVMRQLPDLKRIFEETQAPKEHHQPIVTAAAQEGVKKTNETTFDKHEDSFSQLKRMAEDKDDTVRRLAVEKASKLAITQPSNGVDFAKLVIHLMEDGHPAVRRSAAQNASELAISIPSVSEEIIECIKKLLQDEDFEVRVIAVAEATKLGIALPKQSVEFTSGLLDLMDVQDWRIREAAAKQASNIVKHYPDMAKQVVDKLRQKMKDPDWHVRRATVEQALDLAEDHLMVRETLLKGVVNLKRDVDWEVREIIAKELARLIKFSGQIQDQTVRLTLELIEDKDWHVCKAAAEKVAELVLVLPPYWCKSIAQSVFNILEHDKEEVRKAALISFNNIVAKLALEDLKKLTMKLIKGLKPKDLLSGSPKSVTLLSIPGDCLLDLGVRGNRKATKFCAFYFLKRQTVFEVHSYEDTVRFEIQECNGELIHLVTSKVSAEKFVRKINTYLQRSYTTQ